MLSLHQFLMPHSQHIDENSSQAALVSEPQKCHHEKHNWLLCRIWLWEISGWRRHGINWVNFNSPGYVKMMMLFMQQSCLFFDLRDHIAKMSLWLVLSLGQWDTRLCTVTFISQLVHCSRKFPRWNICIRLYWHALHFPSLNLAHWGELAARKVNDCICTFGHKYHTVIPQTCGSCSQYLRNAIIGCSWTKLFSIICTLDLTIVLVS